MWIPLLSRDAIHEYRYDLSHPQRLDDVLYNGKVKRNEPRNDEENETSLIPVAGPPTFGSSFSNASAIPAVPTPEVCTLSGYLFNAL